LLLRAPPPVVCAVCVVRRALPRDAGFERLDDPLVQSFELRFPKPPGRAKRMDLCPEERLVRIDVADAGEAALVEQDRLDGRRATARLAREHLGREGRVERLRAEPLAEGF